MSGRGWLVMHEEARQEGGKAGGDQPGEPSEPCHMEAFKYE